MNTYNNHYKSAKRELFELLILLVAFICWFEINQIESLQAVERFAVIAKASACLIAAYFVYTNRKTIKRTIARYWNLIVTPYQPYY